MKEIVHCWEDAQFVLSPSLLAPRKLDLTPSQADIHSFWLWPFFLLWSCLLLKHISQLIYFFSHPHQQAETYIPSRCILLFRKYFFCPSLVLHSLPWGRWTKDILTCGRVLLIVTETDVLLVVFPTLSEGYPSVQTSLACTLPQIKCLKPMWPQSS